jgi:hypothetical protein
MTQNANQKSQSSQIEKIDSPSHRSMSRPYRANRMHRIRCILTGDEGGTIPRRGTRRPASGVDRGRARVPGQRDHLAEARLTISGNHLSARPIGHYHQTLVPTCVPSEIGENLKFLPISCQLLFSAERCPFHRLFASEESQLVPM